MKVCVVGAAGRMGQEVCRAILKECDLELAGAVDLFMEGKDIGEVIGTEPLGINIVGDIQACIEGTEFEVIVDFTHPESILGNIKKYINSRIAAVIGTTGLSAKDLEMIAAEAQFNEVPVLVAPNFAIGAILMMYFAGIASKYLENAEIIELHHDKKADAPSGTSIKTAEKMDIKASELDEKETFPGARGAVINNIHVHSVRLPGLVAHQEVIFGGIGQTLTIRHDSIDRTSFMPGVILAVKRIKDYPGLTYGLENLLDL